MTDESELDIPKANVRRGYGSLLSIWLVPIIALAVAAFLIIKTVAEQGTEISVVFENAEGLTPGKTQLKFKDVNIGLLKRIDILDNEEGVSVVIDVNRAADKYLTDTARFWVVSPSIGLQGITGLQTILSGSFIEIDPGKGGGRKKEFVGLATPPVITSTDKGTEYVLSTSSLGNIERGTPVFYKGLRVGTVLGYRLAENNQSIDIYTFVKAPFDSLVLEGTNFWNAGGVNVKVSTNGIEVGAESLQALLTGAVEFDTQKIYQNTLKAENGHIFTLYKNLQAKENAKFTEKADYLLYFAGSVSGLSVGAPVEFRGIKIGSVKEITLEIDEENQNYYIPVLIEIEPQRISITNADKKLLSVVEAGNLRQKMIENLIKRGLKGKLKSASFLTGQLLVDLVLAPDKKAEYYAANDNYPEIPTIPADIDEITTSVALLVEKFSKLPIEEMGRKLTDTVGGIDKFINSGELQSTIAEYRQLAIAARKVAENFDEKTLPKFGMTLDETRDAIKKVDATLVNAERLFSSANSLIADGSPFKYDLTVMLQELSAASRAVRGLAEFLERNPSALISGKR
jgi:paraquat-inducible protein B